MLVGPLLWDTEEKREEKRENQKRRTKDLEEEGKKSDSKPLLLLLLGGSFNPASLPQIVFLFCVWIWALLAKYHCVVEPAPIMAKKHNDAWKIIGVSCFSCMSRKTMASCGSCHVCFSLEMPLFRYVIAGKKGLIQNHIMTAFLYHGVCLF